ncbi:hypothetical protein N431DRAFT_436569 [Stipitochalara longipes BDJ]|nr:hypothetical protein N431DRAFT_436569 [Stipitochalara longipes BDJ]
MHVWAETTIQAPAILLLSLACLTSISSANILTDIPKNNPLNIWYSPAPPPADGPPLSASASRDRALIPAQVGGIIGAYLFSVCVVGIALILLGRKLRRQIQASAKALDIEMVEPRFETAQATPHRLSAALRSPGGSRNFSYPSPERDTKSPYIFPPSLKSPKTPPAYGPYVDTRIVEADREMLNRDLEDIYAHVMEQEEAKAQGIAVKEMPLPAQLLKTGPVPNSPPQRQSTFPPKKIEKSRPANLNIDETRSVKSGHSRISSIISSIKSPRKKTMQISSPMLTPASASFPRYNEEEEPLSPRYYQPPPPPPVPRDQVPYPHHRNTSNLTATLVPLPSSPRSNLSQPLSPRSPYGPSIRTQRSQHQMNPSLVSQLSVQSSMNGGDISATSQTPLNPLQMQPPPKRQPSPNPPPSNNSSQRQLPLRQFEPAVTSPSFAPSTKTTVLERNGPVGGAGPQTGGLRTPWSAGAVPYSPYQPFTPMMPITPRLVTKEERKAMKKREGRTPVLEMIKGEDELWDSAY